MSTEPLQWKGDLNARRRAEVSDGCVYAAVPFSYDGGPPVWEVFHGYAIAENRIHVGDDESEALAAAEAHHVARTRRLAWERYMAENDPPSNGQE